MKSMKWILLCSLLAGTAVAGAVYKWKDADGRIIYSDTPPPAGASSLPIRASEQPVSSIVSAKALPITGKNASGVAEASAPAAEASSKDPKLCQQAQARKAFLQSGQLTKSVNEKGEVEFMNEQKRATEMAEAQKAIDRFCP